MRVPDAWQLRARGVPMPPVPSGAEHGTDITAIRVNMPEQARQQPSYAADNHVLWTAYF